MNPYDDHELFLWAMRAGLTRAKVRQTVRRGLDAGHLSWPGANETAADRQHRLQAARDSLYDQLLSGYDVYQSKVAGWQGASRRQRGADGPLAVAQPALPRPLAVRRAHATHVKGAVPQDEYGAITDPTWVLRPQSKHAFQTDAIARSSFLGIEAGTFFLCIASF